MKSSRLLPLLLLLAACSPKAGFELNLAQAPEAPVVVALLDFNTFKVLDTVTTDAAGRARYALDVKAGQPEFVYLFCKDRKIASLLLSEGEKAKVTADTLGNFEVEGSPESVRLRDNEREVARFAAAMDAAETPAEMSSEFIKHYRACVRYVLENPTSLTVIPVLYEQLDEYTPVFCQHNDAILFRKTVDTLKTVYPESRYVNALEKETERRESAMKISSLVGETEPKGYLDLNLPDYNGNRTSISGLDARVVLLHFWDSSDAAEKMFNVDVLKPVWEQWHSRGFEIYAVDLNPDKSAWASVVKAQELPWINVNDGRGPASSAVMLYNLSGTPTSYLLADGELTTATIDGASSLRRELQRLLR